MLWKVKVGNTFVDMPEPSSYQIDGEDVDTDSYRSVINHNMIRTNITKKWQKVQMMFRFKTEEEANDLVAKINPYPLTCQFRTPILSSADTDGLYWKTLTGYVSRVSMTMHDIELGYEVSFNFIEGTR